MVKRIALLAFCAASAASQASITFTDDITAYGFSGLGVLDTFEAFAPKDVGMPSLTSGGATYNALTRDVLVASPGYVVFGISGATTTSILCANGDEDFEMLPSYSARRIGMDTYTIDRAGAPHSVPGAPPVHVTVTSTSEFAEYDVIAGPDNFGFMGIVSSDPIVRVTWYAKFGGIRDTGIDNIRASELAPEPVSIFAVGLGLAGLSRRRRKKL